MRLYFEAEKFVTPSKGHGSLQLRIFNDKSITSAPKHLYAVVYSTLKYKQYIQLVIKKSKIKQELAKHKKHKVSDALLLLLVHDLVFSPKGRIQSGKHPIKDLILANKTRLSAEFIKVKLQFKARNVADLPTTGSDDETPVRWFRVNTIKLTEDDVFAQDFFKKLILVETFEEVREQLGRIYKDAYIPHLYGINPTDRLTSTKAYLEGQVIIQDRALCFPAHILNETNHVELIDATAAPGNKTTHAAQYLHEHGSGVVYAFERDHRRVDILKKMCAIATGNEIMTIAEKPERASSLIQIAHLDFTTTTPLDFPNVTGLLVDPSCSGSGIFGRAVEDSVEEEAEQEIDVNRLQQLALFQFTIVKHAMQFPLANRVVYSTCSIHPHENERVVVDLLCDLKLRDAGWRLDVRENVLNSWPRRGWTEEFSSLGDEDVQKQLAGGCVRSVPKEDGGIGFFAACFVKDPKPESE